MFSKEFCEGALACRAGVSRDACPYAMDSASAIEWLGGWDIENDLADSTARIE